MVVGLILLCLMVCWKINFFFVWVCVCWFDLLYEDMFAAVCILVGFFYGIVFFIGDNCVCGYSMIWVCNVYV